MSASARDRWAPGPSRPLLTDGAVHVWRADLTKVSDDPLGSLSADERLRGGRFADERTGRLWRGSRALLRVLLGRYLGRDPSSLRFVTGEHGKPALADDAAVELAFNMSHSGEIALYAFSSAGEVGVDVELARRPIDAVAIAKRMLGKPEAMRLQALDPSTRRREFLRVWTRLEAELKCLGVGIGGAEGAHHRSVLWVAELALPGAAGAVAASRPTRALHCWEWQP